MHVRVNWRLCGRSDRGLLASWLKTIAELKSSNLQGVEPFGFTDGISQPTLNWQQNRTAAISNRLHQQFLSRRIFSSVTKRISAATPTGRCSCKYKQCESAGSARRSRHA